MQQPIRPIDIFNMDAQSYHVYGSMVAAHQCVARLMREGFTVLAVHVGNRNPRIVIQSSARCERLRGAVAIRMCARDGRQSVMVAELEGCQVQWTEKGD